MLKTKVFVSSFRKMELVCGSHLLTSNKTFEDGQKMKIIKAIGHEGYNWRTYENDIALLFIEHNLTPNIGPICLPKKG